MKAGMGRSDEKGNEAIVHDEKYNGQANIFCTKEAALLVLGAEPSV